MSNDPYTKTPNAIYDAMSDMSDAELRVSMAIVRKTAGWRKSSEIISLSEFQEMTGMSRPTVTKGIQEALERGLISRTGEGQAFRYQLGNEVNQQASKDSLPVNGVDQTGKDSLPELGNEVNQPPESIKETVKKQRKKQDDATHRRPPKRARPKRKPISEKPTMPKEPTEWQEFVGALCWVCYGHQEVQDLTDAQRGALTAEAKKIRSAGHNRDALKAWFVNVWKLDWRWRKNQDRPKPCDVRSSIAAMKAKIPEGFDDASVDRTTEAYAAGRTTLTAAQWQEQLAKPNNGPY